MKYNLNRLFLILFIIPILFSGCTKSNGNNEHKSFVENSIAINSENREEDDFAENVMVVSSEDVKGEDFRVNTAPTAAIIVTVPYQSQYGEYKSFEYAKLDIPENHVLNRLMQHVTSKNNSEEDKKDSKFFYIKFFYIGMNRYCMIKVSSEFDIDKYDGYAYIDNKLCFIMSRNVIKLDRDNMDKLMIKIDTTDTIHDGIYDPRYFTYEFTSGKIRYFDNYKENIYWAQI